MVVIVGVFVVLGSVCRLATDAEHGGDNQCGDEVKGFVSEFHFLFPFVFGDLFLHARQRGILALPHNQYRG